MPDLNLPRDHPFYKIFVYDTKEGKWYNKRTDIYLSDDDVIYHKLPDPSTLTNKGNPS